MHRSCIHNLRARSVRLSSRGPQLAVDAVEERLDLEGFRRPKKSSADDDLWAIWQRNDMDLGSQRAHLDAPGARPVVRDGSGRQTNRMTRR